MELYFFKNKIIREVKEELIHCFAYSDFDLSADLCGLNLKPFIDAGIDISNTSLTFDLKTKEWKEGPIDRLLFVRTISEFKQYAESFANKCAIRQIGINNSSKLFFKLHLYCFSPFSVFLIVCSHM